MVEAKTVAGKKALGASFSQCRVEVGDISYEVRNIQEAGESARAPSR